MIRKAPQPIVPTIPAALRRTAELWPERSLHVYDSQGVKTSLTWPQVLARAERVSAVLRERGLKPGSPLMVVAPHGLDLVTVLLGAMCAGVVPVPLSPPRQSRSVSLNRYHASLNRLGTRIHCTHITTPGDSDGLTSRLLTDLRWEMVVTTPGLAATVPRSATADPCAEEGQTAYIQLSSGSTGPPKAVLLTHYNILANVHAVGERLGVTDDDVGVSWLPLHNDMGLVGVLFFAIYWGLPLVLLDPDRFLKAPHEWLWAFTHHQGTLSPAPDFGFHYCARRAKRSDLEGLNLSTWRVAICGSEPVVPAHIRAFERRFKPYGLRPNVVVPVYGLAEATLAVTFGEVGTPMRVDRIDRSSLEQHDRALPDDDATALEYVGVGTALADMEVEIHDSAGCPLPDRHVGEVIVRGHSVATGFVLDGEDVSPSVPGQGVATGDLGYMVGDELFITGRRADAVRLPDRTIYPHELENLVGRIEGVRPGSVAVFGIPRSAALKARAPQVREAAERVEPGDEAEDGGELLVIAVEVSDGLDHAEMKGIILEVVYKHLGLAPHDVRILSPQSVPKTSSGKIRRFLCKQLYLDEALDRRERQERWQAVTQLSERARGFVAQFGRRLRGFFSGRPED